MQLQRYELTNGLRVILVQDARAPEVQVTMRYGVGAVDDPPGQDGVAHLVEHLMFEQVVGERSIYARLQDHATSFNAFTTHDATTYVARAHPDRLGELLSIDAVRIGLRCTSITDSVFTREREVVLGEIRLREQATAMYTVAYRTLFPDGHPYRDAVGGSLDTVGQLTREQACAFADAHYAPKNAVLVVSGPVTEKQLHAALGRFFGPLPGRPVAARPAVARVPVTGAQQTAKAPVDGLTVIAAWPLPHAMDHRMRMRTVAESVRAAIDAEVRGRVALTEIGDQRERMLAIVVAGARDESRDDIVAGIQRGITKAPEEFASLPGSRLDDFLFDTRKQLAIHELFAGLGDAVARDARLAAYVIAGDDPRVALAEEMAALRALTRESAETIAKTAFPFAQARIAILEPTDDTSKVGGKVGEVATLRPPVHDLGIRRAMPDVAEAAAPARDVDAPKASVSGATTRRLANGMQVVLLPMSSVPAIEIRLVFAAGTADEDDDHRGAALVAAYGLEWRLRHINDMLAFAGAGGSGGIEVGFDHTTFTARGLDMHVDYLLAGLRRWVRDGRYGTSTETVVDALRTATKHADDKGLVTDAWRSARYGSRHPYVEAGITRHVPLSLRVADAEAFRARHYTPGNATLVISGRFDAALADRWIEYLFGDWTGSATPRAKPAIEARPISLARDEAASQVAVAIALPVRSGSLAEQRVATAMLSEIATDVRNQLGASYDLDASFDERRLAAHHVISGRVTAERTTEALELLRTRLAALQSDPEERARSFVRSRRRVLSQLATAVDAQALAVRAEHAVALARDPLSDFQLASAVQRLTVDRMTAALADLDLARAAILLHGPAAEIDRAYTALGRTPQRLVAKDTLPTRFVSSSRKQHADDDSPRLSEIEEPLTRQPARHGMVVAVGGGFGYASSRSRDMNGPSVSVDIGRRFGREVVVGGHASIAKYSGTYNGGGVIPEYRPLSVVPLSFGAFVHATRHERFWGGLALGMHFDHIVDPDSGTPPTWYPSFALGLEGGFDLRRVRDHRFGLYARLDTEIASTSDLSSIAAGFAYRYW